MCGVLNYGFFLFDFYFRILFGKMFVNGKSICKIVKSVDEVYMYIIELVYFMGFFNVIECEIIGMFCM